MSGVHIDTELVHGCAKRVAAAQNGVGNTWQTLAGALFATAGMAGNPSKDQAAAKFEAAYMPAVHAAWRGFATMHRVTGHMSRGLTQTANNHAKADHDSMIRGGFSTMPSFMDQVLGFEPSGPLNVPAPPSVAGPGQEPPHSLLGLLTGIELIDISEHWPTADSLALGKAAVAWKSAHDRLIEIRGGLAVEVRTVTGQGDAPDLEAFGGFWGKLYTGGAANTLFEGLPQLCAGISKACIDYGTAVRDSQVQMSSAAPNPIAVLFEVAAVRAALAQAAGKLLQAVSVIAVGALAEHLITSVNVSVVNAPTVQILQAATEGEGGDQPKSQETIHSRLRSGEGDRAIDSKEVIENADEVLWDENGNQVYVWRQGNGQSQVTIRDPSTGNILTNQWSTDPWIERQVGKDRWARID
jgi:hypothetical protein